MIRLQKLGLVREVETEAEADRYLEMGYEEMGEVPEDGKKSKGEKKSEGS